MKEDTRLRKKNVKGSVLFTVVAVMMVMIVFVMATLTLAGVANRRSYASYSKNQTTYTARAAVDSVVNVLSTPNTDPNYSSALQFATAIKSIDTKGNSDTIQVSMPSGIGEIGYYDASGTFVPNKILIECVQDDYVQYAFDSSTNNMTAESDKRVLKITATSRLADEESTVSLYLIKDPIVNPPSSSGAGAGLITTGGASTGSSSITVGGGTAVNLKESKWQFGKNYRSTSIGNNDTNFLGISTIVGSVNIGSNTKYTATSLGDGFTVFGDLSMQKDGMTFNSTVDSSHITDYNKIPHVYVEGKFAYDVNAGTSFGTANTPLNLYVGGYMTAEAGTFYSDVYIYNHDFSRDSSEYDLTASEYANNDFNVSLSIQDYGGWKGYSWSGVSDGGWNSYRGLSKLFANANGSSLINWTANTLTNQDVRKVGGNVYSKGSMEIGGNGTATIGGDLYVEKDLVIRNTVIEGSLTCNGTLYISDNVTVKGGIYMADPNKLYYANSVRDKNGNAYNFDASLSNADNLNNFNANTDNLGAVVFPTNKELPEILGYGNQANQIVSSVDDLEQSYDVTQYPTTMSETPTITYDVSPWNINSYGIKTTLGDLKNSISNPNIDTYMESAIGTSKDIYYIDSSCNLIGTAMNNTIIYVDPVSDIWINLDNFSLDNQSAIVVNSTAPGKVYFYIGNNKILNLNNSYVMTSYYYDLLKNNKPLDMKEFPDATTDEKYSIPNAYIYSGDASFGGRPRINYTNNCCISAYIYSPNLDMSVAIPKDFSSVSYNGVPVVKSVAVVGATFVHEMNANNKTGTYYISDSTSGGTPIPTPVQDLTFLKSYYQNS